MYAYLDKDSLKKRSTKTAALKPPKVVFSDDENDDKIGKHKDLKVKKGTDKDVRHVHKDTKDRSKVGNDTEDTDNDKTGDDKR